MRNDFEKAMQFRHACKLFDENKKVSNEDIKTILEAGRLSPSAFGVEPWKFLVITNQEIKEKLRPVCWNQAQITSCSHLVVVLAAIEDAKVEGGKVKQRFQRWGMPDDQLGFYLDAYANSIKSKFTDDDDIYRWTSRETYLAAANMMTCAAFMEIDSCPIKGFEKEKVEEILNLDTSKFQVSLLIPFGYRVNPAKSKTRLGFDEVVEWIE